MSENNIAKVLKIIGWVIIFFGIIGSLVLGEVFATVETYEIYTTYRETSYNWTAALVGSFSSIVSGVILIGFSEVIVLLQRISRRIGELEEIIINTREG